MYFSLLAVLLIFVVKETLAANCGGVQNKYVCHESNPTIFMICIGEQMYTMRCPGGLHFNSRTQTCDWPKNAFCGSLRQPKVTASHLNTRNPYLPPFQSKANSVASKRHRGSRKKVNIVPAAHGPGPSVRKSVFRKRKPVVYQKNDRSRSRYTVKLAKTNPTAETITDTTTKVITSTQSPSKSKWTLAHYPWWAAKSPATRPTLMVSVPKITKAFTKASTKGPILKLDLMPISNNVPVRPGLDVSNYTPRKPDRNNAPRAPNSVAAGPPKMLKYNPPVPKKKSKVTSPPRKLTTKFKPTKTGKCDTLTCQLPDCKCADTNIPGNVSTTDTPMMIMVTFDDSVNIGNNDYYLKLFDDKRKNPNGCPHRGTFFVSGDATQYHYVRDLYKTGNEISSHSISHRSPTTWWAHAGYDGYVKEIEGMSKRLAREGNLPRKSIKGMRVPFLQVGGDGQYQMLEDYGYQWDSSMVTGNLYRNANPTLWPFTLDYPPNSQHCSLAPCPTKSYPGLWEVPLVRWYGNNKLACAMPDGCTIGPGRKGTLEYLMDNFNRQYKANKAPLGIFLHASWFRRKSGNFEGLVDFLEKMTHLPDVYVLTVSQVIDWIRHPVPLNRVSELKTWQCSKK